MATTIITLILAYIIGSIRFAYLCAWLFKLKSPDSVGSKNPGATNIARQNKFAGIITFLLDALKVQISYYVALLLTSDTHIAYHAIMLTITAHIIPIYGKGGKGVACWISSLYILSFPSAIICFITILTFGIILNQLGIGSVLCVLFMAISPPEELTSAQYVLWQIISLIIVYSHRSNIQYFANLIRTKYT